MASAPDPRRAPDGGVAAGDGQRIRLDVAYDGSGFHGFAENRGVPTVGGALRQALERVLRSPVELTCAGRTDAGVHALGQVVTFDVAAGDLARLAERDRRGRGGTVRLRDALNGLLGPAVVVRSVTLVDRTFDARFSARSRRYRYRVWSSPLPDPFRAEVAWWVDESLDVASMNAGGAHLLGTHDFSAFCRRPKATRQVGEPASLVRTVRSAEWSAPRSVEPAEGIELTFTIDATAFCHQMVRSITGMLVDVGRGRRSPDDVAAALVSRDRAGAGQLAPPHGLFLWEVRY